MLTRLLCALFRHPLVTIKVHDTDPSGNHVSLVGERCRCSKVVGRLAVYGGQFPRRRA